MSNYNYEKGLYSTIEFKYDEKSRSLTIGKRRGEYPGMLKSRTINLIYVTPGKPVGYNPVATPQESVTYDGDEVSVTLN
jgi:alpha-D-xyloside xylohydrolase